MSYPVTKKSLELLKKIEIQDQIIRLTVDAERLYMERTIPRTEEMYKYCALTDKEHSTEIEDNVISSKTWPLGHFTSEVFIRQTVTWYAETDDEGYDVTIEKIVHEPRKKPIGNPNFFDGTTLIGKGMVIADVRDDKELVDDIYVYSIHFRIHAPKGGHKDYMIDPKLCANN